MPEFIFRCVYVQEIPKHEHSGIDWWAYRAIRNRMPMWYWRQTSHISNFGMCRFLMGQGHKQRELLYPKRIVIHAYVKSLRFICRHRRRLKNPNASNMNGMELMYNLEGTMTAVECVALYSLWLFICTCLALDEWRTAWRRPWNFWESPLLLRFCRCYFNVCTLFNS